VREGETEGGRERGILTFLQSKILVQKYGDTDTQNTQKQRLQESKKRGGRECRKRGINR